MKNEEHRGLWSKIQQFPLDDPNAAITFSRKLSAKQNWSTDFTERVVEEYRKFLFLCCISPNGASPSQAVDEAWHLHLTYTRSYWTDLCKNTLNKDIHHHPSRGGDEEDHKHRDWYAETLILYEAVFGSPPPADIWPPPQDELSIPEPAWHIRNEVIALVVTLLTLPLLISASLYEQLIPFTLTGKQFLNFFPMLVISSIICYILIQRDRTRPLQQLVVENFPTDATVFQTALFLYGKHRAIQTAIIDLLRRNLLEVTTEKTFIVHKSRYHRPANEQNPLITGFLNEERHSVTYFDIDNSWFNEDGVRHPILQKLYLLAYRKENFLKMFHVFLIPFSVGIIRCFQGLFNDKPVSYLFWELLVTTLISGLVLRYASRKVAVFNAAKEMANYPDAGKSYEDSVVISYARGENIVSLFAEGLLLTSIFAPYPMLDHTRAKQSAEGYSSCSSCNSGGDGGGGCGSSCGGGCGGCGGGD
jgi:uncharacterized protein (TIGR04222 family)